MLREGLKGKKTYIFCALLALNFLYSLVTGDPTPTFEHPAVNAADPATGLLEAGAIASLRAAITRAIMAK
jgi:hypothetical protein